MIADKRMRLVKSEDGLDYYVFTPSARCLYYNDGKREEWPRFRNSLRHWIHMQMYLRRRGGYGILYLARNDDIVSYLVYARAGGSVVAGTTRKDLFTVFVFTYPAYRRQGYASRLVRTALHDIGLSYETWYKTIRDDNAGSIGVALHNGYRYLYPVRKNRVTGRFARVESASKGLYACARGRPRADGSSGGDQPD